MPALALLAVSLLAQSKRPALRFENLEVQNRLGIPFEDAIRNMLDINTVVFDPKVYNATGLLKGNLFVRAGGGYGQPWTRDAAINSWNALSLCAPDLARNTLWAATRPDENNDPMVQRDNQWWDKVIWIVGAWNHYLVTGDKGFLKTAYAVSDRLLAEMKAARFNAHYGLFMGPSFFNDGIAGYPSPPAEADDSGSSFVLDHAGADRIMALSTNCLYVGAYRAAAAMSNELGRTDPQWNASANALRASVLKNFWRAEPGTFGYLIGADGKLDPSQEACGIAFAVLFGIAKPAVATRIIQRATLEPQGIVDVYPNFPRFSDDRPGRHNAIVWPMVQGMWARAATKVRDAEGLGKQIEGLAHLESESNHHFFEIYNAKSGKPDGGWQNAHHWDSAPDQTWSATAYISMITNGLFGMRFLSDGLTFDPLIPKGLGTAILTGIPYRAATLDIVLRVSHGGRHTILLDGKRTDFVPTNLVGWHHVEVVCP